MGSDGNPVGDDEYEGQINQEEAKKDLGALEAAKMAIKFLDQAIQKLRQRRKQTGIQIEEDEKEIACIDSEIAILSGKQGVITAAQTERKIARDRISEEVVRCTEGFQTVRNRSPARTCCYRCRWLHGARSPAPQGEPTPYGDQRRRCA